MEYNSNEYLTFLDSLHYSKETPSLLIKAIKTNNDVLANLLIKYKIRLNAKDENNNNALFLAIEENNIQILKNLIDSNEINIEDKGYKNHTIFTYACKKGNKEIIQYLLTKNVNTRHVTISGCDAIIYSSIYGNIDILELLIDENTTFIKNFEGNDALLYACKYNNYEIVKFLLEHGANINVTNNLNETPLSICCKLGHKNIVKYLFECNQKIDYKLNLLLNSKTIKELSEKYKWKELLDLFLKK